MRISILFLFALLVFVDFVITGRGGGRGGGSRSGGSRSFSSRSSRSGSSSSVRTSGISRSSRYSSWAYRSGVSVSVRYKSTYYYGKRDSIRTGLILMSPRFRSRFIYSNENSYERLSICYNEEGLYGRNITFSPWFVCPWEDTDNFKNFYCCGSELAEYCCAYQFDQSAYATKVISIVFTMFGGLILVIVICVYYKRKSQRKKMKLNQQIVTYEAVVPPLVQPAIDIPLVYPTNPGGENINCAAPSYPELYPSGNVGLPYPMEEKMPLANAEGNSDCAIGGGIAMGSAPYPTYGAPQPIPGQNVQVSNLSYDNAGPCYPVDPQNLPMTPPPSYSEVMNKTNA